MTLTSHKVNVYFLQGCSSGIVNRNNNSIHTVENSKAPSNTGFHPCSKSGINSYISLSRKFVKVIECPVNITIKNNIPAVKAIPFAPFAAPYIDKSKKTATKIHEGVAIRNDAFTISINAAIDKDAKKVKYKKNKIAIPLPAKLPNKLFCALQIGSSGYISLKRYKMKENKKPIGMAIIAEIQTSLPARLIARGSK